MSDFYVIRAGETYPQSYCGDMAAAEARKAELEAAKPGDWRVIPCDQWVSEREESYISKPLEEITRERFWEMLEILPPLYVPCGDCCQRFNMSEFTSGRITQQFAEISGRYFSKYVRHGSPETYISAASVAAL